MNTRKVENLEFEKAEKMRKEEAKKEDRKIT